MMQALVLAEAARLVSPAEVTVVVPPLAAAPLLAPEPWLTITPPLPSDAALSVAGSNDPDTGTLAIVV